MSVMVPNIIVVTGPTPTDVIFLPTQTPTMTVSAPVIIVS